MGRHLFTYEVRESLASDAASGGVGRTPVRYSIVHGMMILHPGSRYEAGACFETSSFYEGPVEPSCDSFTFEIRSF